MDEVTSADVNKAAFTRGSAGSRDYDEQPVDEFLDRLAATLDGNDDVTAAEVRAADFPRAAGKRGYAPDQVHAFLDKVAATLEARATP
ncbi:MAG: cell division protein DivIVA [Amycolatopsis sp.]|uniref:DivIVA domain-containing protein n=1 Tax=Amycolatopsis sp. TaxID=37632 RepID=UPI0026350632|nr:DivIVA domain-containing protein [Amycolatopsis sp.]MCU1681013.1 cell division protein DivIVA [Amycolatopsis sp.]